MPSTHEFPTDRVHFTWDEGNEPVLTIESGDTVVYETREVSDNQITPDSTAEDIASLDWDRVYPLAGPVLVAGAEPGDTLAIEILAMETRGWGYTLIIPGFGLLPDDFPDAYIRVFDLSNGDFAYLRDDIAIPVEPFFGTMGVCPAGAKEQAIMPPGRFGGNMDTRQLVQGTTLYLPVEVDGALFSCGDAHAAQGDGEVCVTGIEAPMHGELRFTLQKGRSIPAPQYETSGPLTPRVDAGGWYGTTGVGPDLYAAAQDAVRAMVDHLAEEHDLSREDAYVLSSLCVDLRISEVVDAGQYVVSALLPLAVFTSQAVRQSTLERAMASEPRQERAARNESLFREVNERIGSTATKLSPMFTEFMCECADDSCFEHVSLTSEEYSSVRKMGPVYFILKPGHEDADIERVVGGEADRYEIVEKQDVAAEVAVELDPRS